MVDVFAGDRIGGAVAQTRAQTICISAPLNRMGVSRLQVMHGSGWRFVRAKSASSYVWLISGDSVEYLR